MMHGMGYKQMVTRIQVFSEKKKNQKKILTLIFLLGLYIKL